jgi:hypothetical protein
MESVMFNSFRLPPIQTLEDFYSAILEKGSKLGEPPKIDYLWFLHPVQELFPDMETSQLPVKGCKI